MLSPREVQHIAKLARIKLSAEEMVTFRHDLASILEYFDTLRDADVSAIEPMTHAVSLQNVKRPDIAAPLALDKTKQLLQMAPETANGYVKIKSMLP